MSDNVEDNDIESTSFEVGLEEVHQEVRTREFRVDEFARRVDGIRYELTQQRRGLPRICTAGVARMFEARRRFLRQELRAAQLSMADAEAVLKRAKVREAELKAEQSVESQIPLLEEGE